MADIELVVKIPEKLACEGFERLFTEEEKNILIKAIGNGIPLPKGHGRLIDVDAIVYEKECVYLSDGGCTTESTPNISATPTIIEVDKEQE